MSFQHRFVQGLGVEKRMHPPHLLGRILLAITLLVLGTQAASADAVCTQSNGQWKCLCSGKWDANVQGFDYSSLDESQAKPWLSPQTAPDLEVSGLCSVPLHQTYYFRNVNIIRTTQQSASGPSRSILYFRKMMAAAGSKTHFWASAIIIENGGELYAYGRDAEGPPQNITWQPFGFNGGVLTIHLYGKNEAEWDPNTQQFVRTEPGRAVQDPAGGTGARPRPQTYGAVRHSQEIWDSQDGCDASQSGFARPGRTRATNPSLRLFLQVRTTAWRRPVHRHRR